VASGRKINVVNFYLLLSAAISFAWLPKSLAALPPTAPDQNEGAATATRPVANVAEPDTGGRLVNFAVEPLRLGGSLSYTLRRDSGEGADSMQQALLTALNVGSGVRGYLWQPWFSTFSGGIGISVQRDSSSNSNAGAGDASSIIGKTISTTGNAQMGLFPNSRFPFEIHYDKTDTRNSNSLSIVDGYVNQRFGFSQHFVDQKINSLISWDRNTQFNERNGESRQDNLQLSMTPTLGASQHLQLTGSSAQNSQSRTDEHTIFNNLTAQHSYTPDPSISVDSSANISQSTYRLTQADSETRIIQLSSLMFWRPKDTPLTVTGGARLLALTNGGSNASTDINSFSFRSHNTNFNAGLGYDFSKYVHLSASGNLNLVDSNGVKTTSNNESTGVTYSPESIKFGNYIYNWSTSGNASRSASEQEVTRQLSLQLSHGLSRNIDMGGGSALTMNVNQALSSAFGNANGSTKQLTHNGVLSWNLSQNPGTALLSLSISDSRTLGGGDAFQMANFQASSNLPSGRYSSWAASLTIQAVRQHIGPIGRTENPGFTTNSSGSISYQNQRAFGVPRLHFVSDIRLNSQALLPLLNGPEEQATSSWENSLDYGIGRTQLRLNTRVAKIGGKTNNSIMFTATRWFGNS
jgi:hypothetical protein